MEFNISDSETSFFNDLIKSYGKNGPQAECQWIDLVYKFNSEFNLLKIESSHILTIPLAKKCFRSLQETTKQQLSSFDSRIREIAIPTIVTPSALLKRKKNWTAKILNPKSKNLRLETNPLISKYQEYYNSLLRDESSGGICWSRMVSRFYDHFKIPPSTDSHSLPIPFTHDFHFWASLRRDAALETINSSDSDNDISLEKESIADSSANPIPNRIEPSPQNLQKALTHQELENKVLRHLLIHTSLPPLSGSIETHHYTTSLLKSAKLSADMRLI